MNNAVKEYTVQNSAATMKDLFFKLRFCTYLMATISSKKHSTVRMQGSPLTDNNYY